MSTVEDSWRPFVVEPEGEGEAGRDAIRALVADTGRVDELLDRHGALVVRGLDIGSADRDPLLARVLPRRLDYVQGNSPRSKVQPGTYTSTEYPAEFTISMHNELSYAESWPARLAFHCVRAPASGGATMVADGADWLGRVPPDVRAAFAGGVRYLQNLHDGSGFGRSWQDTFETGDRHRVDAVLRGAAAEWEWRADGTLRISRLRPATRIHPRSGREVWFNQADQWHVSALDPETAEALLELFGEDGLPQNATFADGSSIPAKHVSAVREAGLAAAVDVEWHAGDLLVLDNVAVAHGRRPFTGPRRVLVAMSA
jgi:alpha-ketoglutarate-dependent taurine dioxygenase